MTHPNSNAAYLTLNLGERQRRVLDAYAFGPLTDRGVLGHLGLQDMNSVRPRISELVGMGLLEECGNTRDRITGRTVRKCRQVMAGQLELA